MPREAKNVIEDIVVDLLDETLALKYDICTCSQCRNDMLAYVLSRLPAKYVTSDAGAMRVIMEEAKVEYESRILREILKAVEVISKNPRHKIKEDREEAFRLLLDRIFEERGLDFRHYRPQVLKRRVGLRMRVNKVESYLEYLRLLLLKPEEYEKLFNVLAINVSEFFRDPEAWITLKEVLDELINKKKEKKERILRIWSAGCANGEEPYSVAILLKEILKTKADLCLEIELFGTDIDKDSLKIAEDARYTKDAIKNVKKELLERYFDVIDNRYQLIKEIKQMVKFRYHNLVSDSFFLDLDLILCRNVFIYLNRSLQEQLISNFYRSLKPEGFLMMGKAETILREAGQIFKGIDKEARIYQKIC